VRARICTRAMWGLLLVLTSVSAGAVPAPSPADDLPIGVTTEFELGDGGVRRHLIRLQAGEFLQIEVREKGPRLVFALLDEDRATLARREARTWEAFTTRRLLFIAPTRGAYSLEVRSTEEGRAGPYSVRMEAPRPAGERERTLAAADAARAEAVRLSNAGTAESRQLALARIEAAVTGFEVAGDRWGEAIALVDLANFRADAWDSIRRAVTLFRELGDREGEVFALNDLIEEKRGKSDWEGMRADSETTAELARATGNPWLIANAIAGMGSALTHTGEAERSAEFWREALAIATDAGGLLQASFSNGLSISYSKLGDWEKAIEHGERALSLWRALGMRSGEVFALHNIGYYYMRLGDPTHALVLLEEALSLAKASGEKGLEFRPTSRMANVFASLGRHDRAIELARRALDLSRELGWEPAEARSLATLGRSLHETGETEDALRHLGEALRIQTGLNLRYEEVDTRAAIADAEADRGDLRAALAQAEAAVTLLEGLRSGTTNPDLRASFVAAEQDTYGTYVDVLMRLHERQGAAGHDATALRTSERARARVMLEALIEARADIRQGVPPTLLDRERALQAEMNKAAARLSSALGRKSAIEDVAAARRALAAVSGEYRLLQSRIRQESPRYAALTQPEAATVEQIRSEVLDDDTVLLEFYLGEQRSFLWALTRSSLLSHPLPGRASIDSAARKVHALMTERQRASGPRAVREADRRLDTEAKALSRVLLGGIAAPLASDWKGKRLLIVTSGALAYLPFGALPSPVQGATRPLLLDHEIVFAPSASVLVAQRQESPSAPPTGTRVAVLADPVFDAADPRVGTGLGAPAKRVAPAIGLTRAAESLGRSGFTRLPFSRGEAEAIAGLVPRATLLKATDFAASRTLVAEGALGDHRVVHFATHGLLDSEHPDLSGLVLSLVDEKGMPQDGFLRMHEIYNLRLPVDLVVLSACQTALGREIRGEGLVGLTRGFMYAGARSVVASLWQVDDESTAELMKRFYRSMLKDGRRPADALRAAQLEMSRHPRWSAPFYWAGFVLQGEWR
jgi:CHAT domain-containing protein